MQDVVNKIHEEFINLIDIVGNYTFCDKAMDCTDLKEYKPFLDGLSSVEIEQILKEFINLDTTESKKQSREFLAVLLIMYILDFSEKCKIQLLYDLELDY